MLLAKSCQFTHSLAKMKLKFLNLFEYVCACMVVDPIHNYWFEKKGDSNSTYKGGLG